MERKKFGPHQSDNSRYANLFHQTDTRVPIVRLDKYISDCYTIRVDFQQHNFNFYTPRKPHDSYFKISFEAEDKL